MSHWDGLRERHEDSPNSPQSSKLCSKDSEELLDDLLDASSSNLSLKPAPQAFVDAVIDSSSEETKGDTWPSDVPQGLGEPTHWSCFPTGRLDVDTTSDEVPPLPVYGYLNVILCHLGNLFADFDGQARSYRGSTSALANATRMEPPEDTIVFSLRWLHEARARVSEALASRFPETDLLLESSERANASLGISIKEARSRIVLGLHNALNEAMRRGRSRHRGLRGMDDIQCVSERLMNEWLLQGRLPSLLESIYSSESDMVRTIEDLQLILRHDADAWVASFFPRWELSQRISTAASARLVWRDTTTCVIDDSFFYHVYYLCTLESLHGESDEPCCGVLVPKAWMEQFVSWLETVRDGTAREDDTPTIEPPGPVDTYSCATAPHAASGELWLLRASQVSSTTEVVPDRLFDFFSLHFGSGPRFSLTGYFSLREVLLRVTKPSTVNVVVEMEWGEGRAGSTGGNVTVHVDDVLPNTCVLQVLRQAVELGSLKPGAMDPVQLPRWSAAAGVLCITVTCYGGMRLTDPMNVVGAEHTEIGSIMRQSRCRLQRMSDTNDELPKNRGALSSSLGLRVVFDNTAQDHTRHHGVLCGGVRALCGVCGLTNIGNTCYMNSALQCLSNMGTFRRRVLSLPISKFPEATITSVYINLMVALWSGHHHCVDTHQLKAAFEAKAKRFAGNQQQDANEYIEVLLDRIHEELNPVYRRKYRERLESDKDVPLRQLSDIFWHNYLDNNKSFIPQLFFYQSKTRFECLTCNQSSTVFDNNLTLSVNIAEPVVSQFVNFAVFLMRKESSRAPFRRTAVTYKSMGTLDASKILHVYVRLQVVAHESGRVTTTAMETAVCDTLRKVTAHFREVYNDRVEYTDDATPSSEDFDVTVLQLPRYPHVLAFARDKCDREGSPGDLPSNRCFVWYFFSGASMAPYYVEELMSNDPKANEDATESSASGDDSLAPGVTPLTSHILMRSEQLGICLLKREKNSSRDYHEDSPNSEDSWDLGAFTPSDDVTRVKVMCRPQLSDELEDVVEAAKRTGDAWITSFAHKPPVEDAQKTMDCTSHLVIYLFCDDTISWPRDVDCLRLFLKTNENHDLSSSPKLEGSGEAVIRNTSLLACLLKSMEPDTLSGDDAWYCPRCKEFRETRVQRSLFRLPPCMVISLKRFRMTTHWTNKNNTVVTFPNRMDFAPYLDEEADHEQPTEYRLCGVVYHSGSLSFGHYTAAAFNEWVKKWVYYNDSTASILQEEEPDANGAYILCYERIDDSQS